MHDIHDGYSGGKNIHDAVYVMCHETTQNQLADASCDGFREMGQIFFVSLLLYLLLTGCGDQYNVGRVDLFGDGLANFRGLRTEASGTNT